MARAKYYNTITSQWEYIDQSPTGATGSTGPMGATGPSGGPQGATGPVYAASVRVQTSATGLIPDLATYDTFMFTALASNLIISTPTGGVNGKRILFIIKDNGVARTLTWSPAYVPIGMSLPTGTVPGKWIYVGAIYNSSANQYHVVGVNMQG